MLAMSMECPLATAKHAILRAASRGMSIALDPGGMESGAQVKALLNEKILIFKPNEHEAQMVTGIAVKDFNSAKRAAQKILKTGVQSVLITVGKAGAYLFNNSLAEQIPIPKLKLAKTKDETGCGDQTMAALCVFLQAGDDILSAATKAVLAGTLQFHRTGIQPVTKTEFKRYT
jgi:ribokinase